MSCQDKEAVAGIMSCEDTGNTGGVKEGEECSPVLLTQIHVSYKPLILNDVIFNVAYYCVFLLQSCLLMYISVLFS